MKRLLIAIALTALTGGGALAQNQARPAPAPKAKRPTAKGCADRANPRCAKQVEFTRGDKVQGDRPSGDGDTLTSRLQGRFGPLIRLRTSFDDKIYKSADSI